MSRMCACVFLSVCVLGPAGVSRADVIYVDADAPVFGNGQTWATAYRSLAVGVAVAQAGDEIWVAEGNYTPPPTPGYFALPSGVSLLGGFTGTESSADERDWFAHRVILDGDVNGDDGPNFTNRADNTVTLIDVVGTDPGTLIDGVVFRGGFAPGGANADGGALRVFGGEITITNCLFNENIALDRGGAVFAGPGTVVVIRDSDFNSNGTSPASTAHTAGGGALWAEEATSLDIRGCGFTDNAALGDHPYLLGGAVTALFVDAALVRDCRFESNRIGLGLGNALALYAANADLVGCDFVGNDTSFASAAAAYSVITEDSGRTTVLASRFYGNGGTALAVVDVSSDIIETRAFIADSVFSANGVGLQLAVNTDLRNCTVTGSNDPFIPYGVLIASSDVTIDNSILWGNSPLPVEGAQVFLVSGSLEVNRSIVQGWTGGIPGTGSFSADPLFVDADGADNVPGTDDDNLRLSPYSPAIDAGDNAALPPDAFDLDGDGNTAERLPIDVYGGPRRADDASTADTGPGSAPIVDIGAAEFPLNSCLSDLNGDGLLDLTDISMFISAFLAGDDTVDLNGDGLLDLGDVILFVGFFGMGCP
ncbi:MAG: right-handed parallel beta-helix repeat-containing protein [Phycisphaeraceae bacterium]|nr:MAG: right-handed parallel beta-helix repeat-containing protein [Phycisphaeraceae bacterium]